MIIWVSSQSNNDEIKIRDVIPSGSCRQALALEPEFSLLAIASAQLRGHPRWYWAAGNVHRQKIDVPFPPPPKAAELAPRSSSWRRFAKRRRLAWWRRWHLYEAADCHSRPLLKCIYIFPIDSILLVFNCKNLLSWKTLQISNIENTLG